MVNRQPGDDTAPDDALNVSMPVWAYPYNDDLLVAKEARDRARADFPDVFYVLDNPELRAAFDPVDREANGAKRRSQQVGIWAVVIGVLSLMGAAAEPLWHDSAWAVAVAATTASLGLTAVLLGTFGVLHGEHKDRWIELRLCTERLRQFHFQAFIRMLPEIARSYSVGPAGIEHFAEKRRETLASFKEELFRHRDAKLEAVLAPGGGAQLWVDNGGDALPAVPEGFDPSPLFKAYRKLRFGEQISYPLHKLKLSSFTLALRGAPLKNQRQSLRAIGTAAFSALIALHVLLLFASFAGWPGVHSPLFHVSVVWSALIALGARTLEEGLTVSRDIERYEDYHATVSDALRRFDDAQTVEDKLRAMIEMERITFDEMRSFLRTAREAAFVL